MWRGRQAGRGVLTFTAVSLVTLAAAAEEPTASGTSAASAAPAAATPASVAPAQVRRDALGLRGISPQMEAIVAGDAAVLARDFADALVKYTGAAKLAPKDPLPHLRLAELHLLEKRPADAEASVANVLRFAGSRLDLEARARFLRALVQELERNLAAADRGWDEYIALADTGSMAGGTAAPSGQSGAPPEAGSPSPDASQSSSGTSQPRAAKTGGEQHAARVYVNSAAERKKAVQAAQKAKTEGEAVGARLTKEIQAADQARAATP